MKSAKELELLSSCESFLTVYHPSGVALPPAWKRTSLRMLGLHHRNTATVCADRSRADADGSVSFACHKRSSGHRGCSRLSVEAPFGAPWTGGAEAVFALQQAFPYTR